MRVRVDLEPIGDRVMVIPTPVSQGLGIMGAGGELVKTARALALEEWQQSEATVFRHGTGVPKWFQKRVPPGSTVLIARHAASVHSIPVDDHVVDFLLVPSSAVLIVKGIVEVEDDEVPTEAEPEPVADGAN